MSDCQHNAPNREPEAGVVQIQGQQSDEQTREMLLDNLTDCFFCEGDPDVEAIEKCLEELEAAGVECEDFDVEQGLSEFHERFAPLFEDDVNPVVKKKKASRYRRPLARIAIIAAALCTFVFTAQASGLDIIGAIARWTSEQFSFVKVGEERDEIPDDMPYNSLQDALDEYGIDEELVPKVFPNNAKLEEVRIVTAKDVPMFFGTYGMLNGEFSITIRQIEEAPHGESEINSPNVDLYVVGGIQHHIMTDVKQNKVMWHNGKWECYIAGALTRDEVIAMIDSIYE